MYSNSDGKIVSLSDAISYDILSNTINIASSKIFDISKGIFVLSKSQKASIIEGVGKDIDIGRYDINANHIISKSLKSMNMDGGLLYSNSDGKIVSLSDALSYDIDRKSVV